MIVTGADFNAATDLLRTAQRVAVVGHIRPDADAIGSVTAVVNVARRFGCEAVAMIGQSDEFAPNLLSIPGADEVLRVQSLADAGEFDTVVVCDCGDISRTGNLKAEIAAFGDRVLVVDHHDSNAGFGTVNLVDHRAESTSTVLLEWFSKFFEDEEMHLDAPLAHCLYAGLVTDTGSFRWGRPVMHQNAAKLLSTGIDSTGIAAELMDKTSAFDLKMIGQVLGGLRVYGDNEPRVAALVADNATISGHPMYAVESLVDFVRACEDAEIGLVMKEYHPGFWACSMRSRFYNVSLIAGLLRGGGHLRAAGFTLTGTSEQVIQQVLEAVKSAERI